MKVSTSKPFQIVYSIYQHEFLGYLLESFVVQKDHNGRLTLQNQNISAANAAEFATGLDQNDFEMIKVIDTIQQDYVVRRFNRSKLNAAEFLHKLYDPDHGDKNLQEQINIYLEKKKARIFALMKGKMLFEMGNDGEPTWKRIYVQEKRALVTFHFLRNTIDTQYFPTITLNDQNVQFQFRGAYIPCKSPAWIVVDDRLYGFSGEIDGN